MAIFSEEQVLKVMYSYNPWWKIGQIPQSMVKSIKRIAYYKAMQTFQEKTLKRYIVLSGARRVGKTTILYQMIEELLKNGVSEKNILYLSLDNPILKFGTLDKILEIYQNMILPEGQIYIFLDEIQYSQDWNHWLKVFYDQNKNWSIVATGSASPLIEQGVHESGVGRWITITVPTLSFYEYCELLQSNGQYPETEEFKKFMEQVTTLDKDSYQINGQTEELLKKVMEKFLLENMEINKIQEKIPKDFTIAKLEEYTDEQLRDIINTLEPIKKYFNRYLMLGGFPELALSKNDKLAQTILREDIVDKVLKRDMPALFKIRNISTLEKVFLYLCFESSNIINYTAMSQDLESVSVPTLQDYVKYLENANLIYVSEQVNSNGAKLLKSKPKIYIADSAIRNAVLMKDDVLSDATEMGYVVETAVFRHVYTYIQNTSGEIGYYREGKSDKEIDIITKSVKENMYIEVKYQENPSIKTENPIYTQVGKNDKLFMITKNVENTGIMKLDNGKNLVKIPAFAYLFLLGLEEFRRI